jgi:hypothetical protein
MIHFIIGILIVAVCGVSGQSLLQSTNAPAKAPQIEHLDAAQTERVVVEVHEQTNHTTTVAERRDQIRNACIKGRRVICGKVIKIFPDGLVVDSGYTALMNSPFNKSWVVDSGAAVSRDSKTLEVNEPGAACIGIVFLTDIPKRPTPKLYDYVVIQGYPVGQHTYTSVPGVQKTVRGFSAGLETAIRMNLEAEQK